MRRNAAFERWRECHATKAWAIISPMHAHPAAPATAPVPIGPVLDYHASRLVCFRTALVSFFRRWIVYALICIVVFGAGTVAPVAIALGLASSLLWPLRIAAAHGWTIVPATAGYAVFGTLPVILTRPLWWPRRWAEAERALPLAADVIGRSDRIFASLMMAPWQCMLAIGAIGGVVGIPFDASIPSERADRWLVLAAWLLSIVASLGLSSSWMRAVRDRSLPSSPTSGGPGRFASRLLAGRRGHERPRATRIRELDVRVAFVLLPIWRGRAKRTAASSALGIIATLASATCPWWSDLSTEWSFALTALAALCATSVLRVATARELQPRWLADRSLPIDGRRCERTRLLLILTPMLAAMTGCLAVVAQTSIPFRPRVLLLYLATLVTGCVIEALTPPNAQPQDHAARWLLMLIAAVAFASELSAT